MTTRNEAAPIAQEVEEQHNESERVRDRIDRLLRDTAHLLDPSKRDAATIDAYAQAENERTRR